MTREEYLDNLKQISDAEDAVNSEYEKVDKLSSTLCEVNQVMSYNPSMQVVYNHRGDVIGYDYKYTSPNPPNTTGMSMDSNIDSGLYASGGGGQTRGGGSGRARHYAGGLSSSAGTDKLTGTGLVSGRISPAWGVTSVLGKMGMRVASAAKDFVAEVGDSFADTFEDLLVPAVQQTADSIRVLFGANPETGEATMYMDEDTIGALAISSRDAGAFDAPITPLPIPEVNSYFSVSGENLLSVLSRTVPIWSTFNNNPFTRYGLTLADAITSITSALQARGLNPDDYTCTIEAYQTSANINCIKKDITTQLYGDVRTDSYGFNYYMLRTTSPSYNYNILRFRLSSESETSFTITNWINSADSYMPNYYVSPTNVTEAYYARILSSGIMMSTATPIDGLEHDPTATSPVDAITGADPHVVATQLVQQYPTVMGSPVQVTVMDDSCNQQTITYYSIPISYSPTNITISAPQSGTTQIAPSFNPDISLPDIDMDLLMQQIIQQLSDSGTGDTATVIPPSEPGEEPEIQLLDDDPPHTGIGDTPVEELPQVDVRSMWHVYNPSVSELAALGDWLWSTNVLDVLIRTFANPLESVMGVHALYAEPSVSSAQSVVVGPLTSNISSLVVSSQYTEVDCGSVWVTEYFGNVFDYEPYTSISLFLPFVGIVPLDISEVMRAEISIRYNVDCYTGACIAMVSVIRDGVGGVLYQFPGNCAVEYPVSGASYSRMLQSMIGAATSALSAGVASGGNPAMGALAAGSSFMSGGQKIKVGHSGSFASNVGAMGSKIPYLIINRPQINMAHNFEKYDGYSSNFTTQLNACKGYTKCKEVHLNCPGAFKSELDEIENLLRSGVIFPSS